MEFCKKNVYELFKLFIEKKPDFIFVDGEEKYTISEFFYTVCDRANYLSEMGVKKGDFVSILCKRDIETLVYFFACQIMGSIALMVDEHEDIKALENNNGLKVKYSIIENRSIKKCEVMPKISFEILNDSKITTIGISTSGSTGDRKIVMHSQYAFINNSFDSKEYGFYEEKDIALSFLPMNHVFAIAMIFTALYFQFKFVIASNIDVISLLKDIEKYHVTRFNTVPTLLLKMVEAKDGFDLSSLKCCYLGGAPCSQKDYLRIEKSLGLKLISVYGMSECIGISTGAYSDDSIVLANSVGRKYPLNDVKIASDGEIMVKSPAMCNGYFNGELPLLDGYLLTGDIGSFDSLGFLHILGRKKEIIIRNGLNISISEIERKLNDIDIFKEYAVVGIEDDGVGEAPALAIVLKDSNNIDLNSILSKYLNKQEMPCKIIILDKLPLLENGKIDKKSIKKLFI